MIDNVPFTLTNRRAKPARRNTIPNIKTTQPILFLGSHTDLPAQQDLFDPNQFIRTVVPQPITMKG